MRQMETHLTSFIVLGLFFMCSPVLFPLCRVNARRHVLGGIFVFEIKRLTLWKTERKPEKLKMFSAQSRGIISPQNFHLNSSDYAVCKEIPFASALCVLRFLHGMTNEADFIANKERIKRDTKFSLWIKLTNRKHSIAEECTKKWPSGGLNVKSQQRINESLCDKLFHGCIELYMTSAKGLWDSVMDGKQSSNLLKPGWMR